MSSIFPELTADRLAQLEKDLEHALKEVFTAERSVLAYAAQADREGFPAKRLAALSKAVRELETANKALDRVRRLRALDQKALDGQKEAAPCCTK